MELLTPLELICRLILRAKELEAQVPAQDPDEDPEDVDETLRYLGCDVVEVGADLDDV